MNNYKKKEDFERIKQVIFDEFTSDVPEEFLNSVFDIFYILGSDENFRKFEERLGHAVDYIEREYIDKIRNDVHSKFDNLSANEYLLTELFDAFTSWAYKEEKLMAAYQAKLVEYHQINAPVVKIVSYSILSKI